MTHDLVALYPEATVRHETGLVDFGSEEARELLVAGFSADETTGEDVSFVWSESEVSELHLFLTEPRALSLRFRCWPFVFAGAPVQTLSLALNGETIAELVLAPEPGEYRVSLPASAQVVGKNVLRFRYGYTRAPSDVITRSNDERRLAVGWDWLRVEGVRTDAKPVVVGHGENAAMKVPTGTRIDYFLNVLPQSTLVVDAVSPDGESVLTVAAETTSTRVDYRTEMPAREKTLELPSSGGLVRLSFWSSSHDAVVRRAVVLSASEALSYDRVAGPRKRRPNIILYLVDTLRADHLGAYGYSKSTPRIDELAADGTLFERALAQSSWTKPASASILTGLHPRAHTANRRTDALPGSVKLLPQALEAMGYETAAFVVNANVSAPFGFDRGFDTFELLLDEDGMLGAPGDQLIELAIDWIVTRSGQEPFFLYVHSADPHDPYATTAGFDEDGFGTVRFMESLEAGRFTLSDEEVDRLVELYDQDVAFADAQLGRFLDALKERGLYEDALIILLSDHGEEFRDHGWWRHGKTLYGEQLRVPLIIKWPDGVGAGQRVDRIVQHIDIAPTVLDYLGRPRSSELAGRSLWRLVASEPLADENEPAVLSYLHMDGREVESVVVGNYKLIRYLSYDRAVEPYQLYDLESDETETTSLAGERARIADFLSDYLTHARPKPAATPTPAEIDEDVERQLRALGYIQ